MPSKISQKTLHSITTKKSNQTSHLSKINQKSQKITKIKDFLNYTKAQNLQTPQNLLATQESSKFQEKCAVVGVFGAPNAPILAYYSLFALQHRGQEASGIAVSDNSKISLHKQNGLVTRVFTPQILSTLKGCNAIGHNRYSTAGEDSINECQPIYARYSLGAIAIAHNGNLTNAHSIRENLTKEGAIFQSHLDTEVLIHLIAKSSKSTLYERIIESIRQIDGAYALVILSRTKMFAIRDPYGLRPLSLGSIKNTDGTLSYIVASESSAFDLVGAEFIRDIEAGEMLVFERGNQGSTKSSKKPNTKSSAKSSADLDFATNCGVDSSLTPTYKSYQFATPKSAPCVFEYIYFARPDSNVFGRNVYAVRKRLGIELAKEHILSADMVIPVPDSGVAAALGYAKQSGIDFELGIIRNHYVGRTFIEPTQSARELKVKLKLNPNASLIKGKDIIVIDDSIVRGTTSKQIVHILRQSGARKIYLLISSPPTISPCYYGVDTPQTDQLICANHSIDEVRDFIGADYLGFLSLEGLAKSINDDENSASNSGKKEANNNLTNSTKSKTTYCQACFDGKYIDSVHCK